MNLGQGAVISIIGIGLLSTSVAYAIFFYTVPQVGANNIMLTTFVIPPLTLTVGYLVLNEKVEPQSLMGLAIIIFALIIIDGRLYKKLRSLCS